MQDHVAKLGRSSTLDAEPLFARAGSLITATALSSASASEKSRVLEHHAIGLDSENSRCR